MIYTLNTARHTFTVTTDAEIDQLVAALRPGVQITPEARTITVGAEDAAAKPAKAKKAPLKVSAMRAPKAPKAAKATPAKVQPDKAPTKPRARKEDTTMLAADVHAAIQGAISGLGMADLVARVDAPAPAIKRAIAMLPNVVTVGKKRGTRYMLTSNAVTPPVAA